MYQTARGPIMGLFEREVKHGVRLWAPAWVNQPGPANVIYLPVFPCETYLDLYGGMIIGENGVPEIIEAGYRGFLGEFIKGSYNMKPVVTSAGIEADPHIHQAPPPPAPDPDEQILEKCPACHMELSNWQGHYPVYLTIAELDVLGLPEDVRRKLEAAESSNSAEPLRHWVCEITVADIRERFPNYTPPQRPMDA